MKELFTQFLVEVLQAKPAEVVASYVKGAKSWMSDSDDVTNDIREALTAIVSGVSQHPNAILMLFAEFLRNEVTGMMDGAKEVKTSDKLVKVVQRYIARKLPETAQREVADIVSMALGDTSVWIRSATAIDAELRKTMRDKMSGKYLIFNVDDELLGGMQMVADGKVLDASWLGRINSWDSLVTK